MLNYFEENNKSRAKYLDKIYVTWNNVYSTDLNDEEISILKDLTTWVLRTKLSDRICNKLIIDVVFCSDMEKMGTCIWEDTHYRPREFTIMINPNQSFKGIINTLSHELMHVIQWAKGRFYQVVKSSSPKKIVYKFEGKIYESWKIPYSEQPWEIEAFGASLLFPYDFSSFSGILREKLIPTDLLLMFDNATKENVK